MSFTNNIEWDELRFTSYIGVTFKFQSIIIDKAKRTIRLEDGCFESTVIERILTQELVDEFERCFEEISIYEWPKVCFNLCADGERWNFEFYKNGEKVLERMGGNAYPQGYGKWIEFYSGLLKENGILEVHSCYRKEREGWIDRSM